MSKTIKVSMPTGNGNVVEKEYTIDKVIENVTSTNRINNVSDRGKFIYTVYDTFTREMKPTLYIAPPLYNGVLYDTGVSIKEIEPLKEEQAKEFAKKEKASKNDIEKVVPISQEEIEEQIAKEEAKKKAEEDAIAKKASEEVAKYIAEQEAKKKEEEELAKQKEAEEAAKREAENNENSSTTETETTEDNSAESSETKETTDNNKKE